MRMSPEGATYAVAFAGVFSSLAEEMAGQLVVGLFRRGAGAAGRLYRQDVLPTAGCGGLWTAGACAGHRPGGAGYPVIGVGWEAAWTVISFDAQADHCDDPDRRTGGYQRDRRGDIDCDHGSRPSDLVYVIVALLGRKAWRPR
jgi:hypothetical protein